MNKGVWKEYLHFLVQCKSLQKLNTVIMKAVQVHPECLDFWLIGIYTELDMKGNLFSSRNLMLQAHTANNKSAEFNLAYLEFELNFLTKVMKRRQILPEQNLPKIAYNNIVQIFGEDIDTVKKAYKLVKACEFSSTELQDRARNAYLELKF
jgi:hypothetical protein